MAGPGAYSESMTRRLRALHSGRDDGDSEHSPWSHAYRSSGWLVVGGGNHAQARKRGDRGDRYGLVSVVHCPKVI
jgi:hypothetical protein